MLLPTCLPLELSYEGLMSMPVSPKRMSIATNEMSITFQQSSWKVLAFCCSSGLLFYSESRWLGPITLWLLFVLPAGRKLFWLLERHCACITTKSLVVQMWANRLRKSVLTLHLETDKDICWQKHVSALENLKSQKKTLWYSSAEGKRRWNWNFELGIFVRQENA